MVELKKVTINFWYGSLKKAQANYLTSFGVGKEAYYFDYNLNLE